MSGASETWLAQRRFGCESDLFETTGTVKEQPLRGMSGNVVFSLGNGQQHLMPL